MIAEVYVGRCERYGERIERDDGQDCSLQTDLEPRREEFVGFWSELSWRKPEKKRSWSWPYISDAVEVMRGASRSSFIGSKKFRVAMLKILVEGVLGLNGAVLAVKFMHEFMRVSAYTT